MATSLQLFELIKSLPKGQKSYFKKLHNHASKTKFMRLFDIGERHIKKNDLTGFSKEVSLFNQIDKDYLFEKILDALTHYVQQKDIKLIARNYLANAEVLMDKTFYEAAFSIINKGLAYCRTYQLDKALLELLDLELKIYFYIDAEKRRSLDEIEIEKSSLIDHLKNVHTARTIEINQLSLSQKSTLHPHKSFDQIMDHSIQQINQLISTPNSPPLSLVYLYNALTDIYNQKGNLNLCFEAMKKLLLVFDNNPHLIHHEPVKYTSAISNCSLIYSHLGDYENAELVLGKLDHFSSSSQRLQNSAVITGHSAKFTLYLKTKQYRKAFQLSQQLETKIDTLIQHVSFYFTAPLFFDAFNACFWSKEYKKSLKWLYMIINNTQFNLRKEYYEMASICEMIVHVELNNYKLIHSLSGSFLCRFDHNHESYRLAKIMHQHLEKAKGKESIDFQKLKQAILDESFQHIINYFDVISWIDIKIT